MATDGMQRGFFRRGWEKQSGVVLLLIGTPGTGKRPVGQYLATEKGFVHLDFGNAATREDLLDLGEPELRARLAQLREGGHGVVITWGAGEPDQLDEVDRLISVGAELIWFDSDRGAACRAHFADAPHPPPFHFVDPFDAEGRFRPVNAVVEELLTPRPRLRPVPARARAGRLAAEARVRYGDALAFLAGAAAATAALLVVATGTSSQQPQPRPVLASGGGAVAHHVAALPKRGVLVSGASLAGVRLGDTMAKVKALWGGRFTRCRDCKPRMWFYLYPPPDDPVGAGVEFDGGRVVAVFTLGAPSGWHTETGIRVGQILSSQFDGKPKSKWLSCAGYSAQLTRSSTNSVTSILTQGAAVYGFALTRPSVSPCH
jgi:hypothetical protein